MTKTRQFKELDGLKLTITIEAEFEIGLFDNMADVDGSIEDALDSLKSYGSANITRRRLMGVVKEK